MRFFDKDDDDDDFSLKSGPLHILHPKEKRVLRVSRLFLKRWPHDRCFVGKGEVCGLQSHPKLGSRPNSATYSPRDLENII